MDSSESESSSNGSPEVQVGSMANWFMSPLPWLVRHTQTVQTNNFSNYPRYKLHGVVYVDSHSIQSVSAPDNFAKLLMLCIRPG